MQATLLGLGIAIILALLAALVGPHFVDWGAYRAVFEARASDALGVPVRIAGRIDARLLPTPAVILNGVETAEARPRLRAQSISAELALGALLRGEWRVTELMIRGPDLTLGLDPAGRVDWRGATPGFDAEKLSIERLDIEDGRLRLAHAGSGAALAIDRFVFRGDVRSLAGPIKGDGEFVLADERYGFRLTTSRRADDGNMRARLVLTPAALPFTAEADGQFRLDDDGPKFDGALTIARAAGVVLTHGRARQAEGWRANGRLKASARQALFEQLEVQYGPDERALKLTGAAELKFTGKPRIEAVLSARQLDLDHFIADEPRPLPLAQLGRLLEPLRDTMQVPLPVRLGLAIDVLTMGGAPLQNLQVDAAFDAEKIAIERFDLRAPGTTNLRASGSLRAIDDWSFSGAAAIEAQDPRTLTAWLEGQPAPAASQPVPLRASGDVTLGVDRIAVERLSAQVEGKPISGRLVYETPPGREPRLEAELRAAELDIDAALATLFGALPSTTFRAPAELALSLDLDRAVLAGIEGRGVSTKLVADATRLRIERLRIADLAGAAIDLSGAIDDPGTRPRGTARVTFSAEKPDRLAEALRGVAPEWAERLRAAGVLGPVRLQGDVSAADAEGKTRSAASFAGTLGAMQVSVEGEATGDVQEWRGADLRLQMRANSEDGVKLAALAGLDRLGAVQRGPATLQLDLQGRPDSGLRVNASATASGLSLAAEGTARLGGEASITADLATTLRAGDLRPLRPLAGAADQPLPASLRAGLRIDGQRIDIPYVSGTLGGAPVSGRFELRTGTGVQVDGAVEAESVDLLGLAAFLSGSGERVASGWPTQVFEPFWLRGVSGRVALSANRALLGRYTVRRLRATVRAETGEAAIEDVDGGFAGGRLGGGLVLQGGAGSLGAALRLNLTSADLAQFAPEPARPPATGRANLTLNVKGAGRSAAALMTTLGGGGTIEIENLELSALAAQAFTSAIEAVDKGAAVEPAALRKLVEAALEKGRLRVARASVPLAVAAGQLRSNGAMLSGEGADVSLTGSVDLIAAQVDARLALIGPASLDMAGAGRPEIGVAIKGPLTSPQRAVDVSSFVGWLTLRSVEQQAKRVEALEAERRAAEAAAAAAARAASREPVGATGLPDQTTPAQEPRAGGLPAETPSPSIVPEQLVPPAPPSAARPRPLPTPTDGSPRIEINPNARTTLPPPPQRTQPRPAQGEAAPPLPPPVDIRPAPGSRRPATPSAPSAQQQPAETFSPRALFDSIFGR